MNRYEPARDKALRAIAITDEARVAAGRINLRGDMTPGDAAGQFDLALTRLQQAVAEMKEARLACLEASPVRAV